MEYIVTRKAAKILGVHPNTLRKWAKEGKIKYIKSASGQRRYNVDDYLGKNTKAETICYCRVSSYKQKDDLQRQIEFMQAKFPDAKIIKDIGSATTFKSKGILKVIEMAMEINRPQIKMIMAQTPINKKGMLFLKRILELFKMEVHICVVI